MKKHLQLILALLCVLALALGINAALAEEETEARIIQIRWEDGDNIDQLRPTGTIEAALAGQKVELNAGNGWSGEAVVPAGTDNAWDLPAVEYYSCVREPGSITVARYIYTPSPRIKVVGSIVWNDNNNSKGIRPEYVRLALYADGEPCAEPKAGNAAVSWDNLLNVKPGTGKEIKYSVQLQQVPDGYTAAYDGTTVTLTLNTVDVTLKASVSGAPEGIDLGSLALVVDGPDPSMPRTLAYTDIAAGCTFTGVLPGAYLVRDINAAYLADQYNEAESAKETEEKKTYYVVDAANSKECDAVYVAKGDVELNWKFTYKEAEDYGATQEELDNYDPEANLGSLSFRILGPETDLNVNYAQFTDGKYELQNLKPGVYTVVELNAETLVKYYTLTSNSTTAVKLVVEAGKDNPATAKLFNQYAPAVTPEPDAEFVDIPVTKTWNDSNDKDKNRPASVTVRLYADGVEVDSHVLTATENWSYTFTEKPRYREDHKTEIVYSVNEDDVPMYIKEIAGYNLVNNYMPTTKDLTVVKVWKDNNDAAKLRPSTIVMTLSINGEKYTSVTLSAENGWSAMVTDVPTVVNGTAATYTWTEQEVISYVSAGAEQNGNTVTFTNSVWTKPEKPTKGGKGKTYGNPTVTLDDYETPLGVEVVINHVGDCFD